MLYMNKTCINPLQALFCLFSLILLGNGAAAQYYYKDIVVTGQISANFRLLKSNKVHKVRFGTFIENQPVADGISLDQTIEGNSMLTHTHTADAPESWLRAVYNEKGQLLSTVDSNAETVTRSAYLYDAQNRLTGTSSESVANDNFSLTETHNWIYGANGQVKQMIKTKNGHDTTQVGFVTDENGNVAEEKTGEKDLPTYYYYDDNHRLTDIARYNQKAGRILPDYMFEYNAGNQVTQMVIVPEGSNDYQTWRYNYNDNALKKQDICYNKQKQLLGKIEYLYEYNDK